MDKALKAISYAIEMERQGEYFYSSSQARVKSPKAKLTFERLAKMEKGHMELLINQYNSLKNSGTWGQILEHTEKTESFFEHREKTENIHSSEYESALGDISIIRMAYLLENDLAEYYKKMSEDTLDPNGKEIFEMLYKWEIEHRDMLHTEYKALMEENWADMGYSPF